MDTAGLRKRSPGARGGHRRAAASGHRSFSEAVHSPAARGHRGARPSRRAESSVDSAFNLRFPDNRLFVLLFSARFCPSALSPSPWSCPCSLQPGFWWVVGSRAPGKRETAEVPASDPEGGRELAVSASLPGGRPDGRETWCGAKDLPTGSPPLSGSCSQGARGRRGVKAPALL